jgi:hypothetical protein
MSGTATSVAEGTFVEVSGRILPMVGNHRWHLTDSPIHHRMNRVKIDGSPVNFEERILPK